MFISICELKEGVHAKEKIRTDAERATQEPSMVHKPLHPMIWLHPKPSMTNSQLRQNYHQLPLHQLIGYIQP